LENKKSFFLEKLIQSPRPSFLGFFENGVGQRMVIIVFLQNFTTGKMEENKRNKQNWAKNHFCGYKKMEK
jgi:hypothetical protein